MKGSTCRWILWSTRRDGSKPYSWSAGFTSHAMRHFWSLASNFVIGPAPLFEARMFFHVVSTSPPSGVTSPRPVTTTRRISVTPFCLQNKRLPDWVREAVCAAFRRKRKKWRTRSALVLVDIVDRVANGRDLLGCVVGNFHPELFLESHDELDDVEAVGAEIVD